MLVNKDSLVFLRVYGWFTLNFVASGHFPILAGYDKRTQTTLNVGLIHLPNKEEDPWYFTCVVDGARVVTYVDEVGEVKKSRDFCVLALRHDPVDIVSPYPQTRKGAMDPTGPLHWLSLWPKKDPEYFEDERLKKADDALESILDGVDEENALLDGFEESEEKQLSVFGEGEISSSYDDQLFWPEDED